LIEDGQYGPSFARQADSEGQARKEGEERETRGVFQVFI